MAQKEQKKGNNEQQKQKPPTESTRTQKTGAQNKTSYPKNTSDDRARQKSIFIRIGNALWGKNNQAQFQNIITLGALAISIWLAIVTYQVFKVAAGQAQSVVDAGETLQRSLRQ
jgi:predicted phage tail protein